MAIYEDIVKLERDVERVIPVAQDVIADMEAIGKDIGLLKAAEGSSTLEASLSALDGSRLKKLVCLSIPIYNMMAAGKGWPVVPVPDFCSTT